MPVYEVKVRGEKSSRIVKASSAAKARDHVVEAKALNADELVDAIAGGGSVETATETESDPPPAGDPPAGDPPANEPGKGK